jgi:hypothetical protein
MPRKHHTPYPARPYDNAMCETSFASLERELDRQRQPHDMRASAQPSTKTGQAGPCVIARSRPVEGGNELDYGAQRRVGYEL